VARNTGRCGDNPSMRNSRPTDTADSRTLRLIQDLG
jgi:hypothetical protein